MSPLFKGKDKIRDSIDSCPEHHPFKPQGTYQRLPILALTSAFLGFGVVPAIAQDEKPEVPEQPLYNNACADIGTVVKDLEKSVKFYRDALGMTEVGGFQFSAKKAAAQCNE